MAMPWSISTATSKFNGNDKLSGLGLQVAEVAVRQLDRRTRREARLLGGDVDRTGRGVLAIQGALRASEHFDLLDVEHLLVELGGVDLLDTINDDRDPSEVAASLRKHGFEPVWKDWDKYLGR
mgnify:CR=1 FL=1